MSKQTLKKLALSILTTALMVAFVGAFTQKTSKKDSPPSEAQGCAGKNGEKQRAAEGHGQV